MCIVVDVEGGVAKPNTEDRQCVDYCESHCFCRLEGGGELFKHAASAVDVDVVVVLEVVEETAGLCVCV